MYKVENANFDPSLAPHEASLWAGHLIVTSPELTHPSRDQKVLFAEGVFSSAITGVKSFLLDERDGSGVVGLGFVMQHIRTVDLGRHKTADAFTEHMIEATLKGVVSARLDPGAVEFIAGYATSQEQLAFAHPAEVFDVETALHEVINRSYLVDTRKASDTFDTYQALYADDDAVAREFALPSSR